MFTNGGGDMLWSNPANWDTNQVPGPQDDVLLPINSIMDGNYTVASVTIPATGEVGAVQTLQGTLTVTGSMSWAGQNIVCPGGGITLQGGTTTWWAGGTFSGDPVNGFGSFVVSAGATVTVSQTLSSTNPTIGSNASLANSGTVTINWDSTLTNLGTFNISPGSSLSNMPGGTLNFGGVPNCIIGVESGTMHNYPGATINVDGAYEIDFWNLVSDGTINVSGGAVVGVEDGSSLGGTVQVGANSTFNVQASDITPA